MICFIANVSFSNHLPIGQIDHTAKEHFKNFVRKWGQMLCAFLQWPPVPLKRWEPRSSAGDPQMISLVHTLLCRFTWVNREKPFRQKFSDKFWNAKHVSVQARCLKQVYEFYFQCKKSLGILRPVRDQIFYNHYGDVTRPHTSKNGLHAIFPHCMCSGLAKKLAQD